jgi:membrane associated rhomboid family serine protease
MSAVVLPVHDINPRRGTPWVTWTLVAVNVAVFVLAEPLRFTLRGDISGCGENLFFLKWAAIPAALTGHTHYGSFADCPGTTVHFVPVLSVLTAVFGDNVEDRMGRLLYLGFYLVCGYAAAYAQALVDPHSTAPLIGASGAIAGVLGAYLLLFPRARVVGLLTFLFFLPVRLPAWIVLGGWFALQWLYSEGIGVASGGDVAYTAHVVGFAVGALLVFPFRDRLLAGTGTKNPPPRRPSSRAHERLRNSGWT